MDQYHILVNLTKRQYVHPHQIGNGLKLHEQVGWKYSTSTALVMLLAASNGPGDGDFQSQHPLVGSWAGDRIAFIGDYAEKTDLPGIDAQLIYKQCDSGKFKNISADVREMMSSEFNIHYVGEPDSWLQIEKRSAPAPKKFVVEDKPLVSFYYPHSHSLDLVYREVRVISANHTHIWGLDTLDKNRIKKFRRDRILRWNSKPIDVFKPELMP
jgi:hypothetical protein